MTSRQRVLRAVNFQRPDRCPIDLSGMRASGINAVVYHQLKQRLGIHTPTKIHDAMQILAEVELEVVERLRLDVLPLDLSDVDWVDQPAELGVRKRLFCGHEVWFPPGTNITVEADGGWALGNAAGGVHGQMPRDGYYFDIVPAPPGGTIDPDRFQPSHTVPDQMLDAVARRAEHLYRHTDKALLGWGPCISMIGLSAMLADGITQGYLDDWVMMLMTEKQTAHDMMGRLVDAVIARLKLFHEVVGDRCFAWGVASDDAGTQKGEFLSPDLWDEMLKPHYRRLCDWVHAHTSWKCFLHSCGSVYHLIPHWIEAGIDIFNPVQIGAANMAPRDLVRAYHGKIVFWGGGCDTQHVLAQSSPAEVRRHVHDNLRQFRADEGGYVFCQVHNIQQNVAVENLQAMYAAVHDFQAQPEGETRRAERETGKI